MFFKLETQCLRDYVHGSMSEKSKPFGGGGSLNPKDNFLLVLGDIGYNTRNTCKKSMLSDFELGVGRLTLHWGGGSAQKDQHLLFFGH